MLAKQSHVDSQSPAEYENDAKINRNFRVCTWSVDTLLSAVKPMNGASHAMPVLRIRNISFFVRTVAANYSF